MKIRAVGIAAVLGAVMASSVSADETTRCNAYITTLPYTISSQGHYCFDRNLSTAMTSGNAITISASYVVLDLNNFKLGGGSAGPATQARGIYALDRTNITVRGGNIRGFLYGIAIDSTSPVQRAQNTTIENNVVDGNYAIGILASGNAVVVRNNLVSNTGGATSGGACGIDVVGISTSNLACNHGGGTALVVHNTVANTVGASGTGIRASGSAAVALENVVLDTDVASGHAIYAYVCRDNTVAGFAGDDYGCVYQYGTNSSN
jgi:parallel beta-helix repeat protein